VELKYQLKASLLDNDVLTSAKMKLEAENRNTVEREKAMK